VYARASAQRQGRACKSSLARHNVLRRSQHQTNDLLTRSIVRVDGTPIEAPYRCSGVEHMGTAFRQKLGYERNNIESVPGGSCGGLRKSGEVAAELTESLCI
jgi:hypothetical protein